MNKVRICDVTLRKAEERGLKLSFNEKINIAKYLDRLSVDVIETMPVKNKKADTLLVHTISSVTGNSVISVPCMPDERALDDAYNAVKEARKRRISIKVPSSTVQMEYILKLKPQKVLQLLENVCKKAKMYDVEIEVSFEDAARADSEFLENMIKTASENGADFITLCDGEGTFLPEETKSFFEKSKNAPCGVSDFGAEMSDAYSMACINSLYAVMGGAAEIKTAEGFNSTDTLAFAKLMSRQEPKTKMSTSVDMTVLEDTDKKIREITQKDDNLSSPFDQGTGETFADEITLSVNDGINTVSKVIGKLGYDLSDGDLKNVYVEFVKAASKKNVGVKELDSIIASTAMQVAPTFKIKSYVINSGDIITATANIELERNGEILRGICTGDGPIDAAFLAIENITGHHFELDDFKIKAVTGGYEAMGSSLVKLRHNGTLYSGSGISTDIVGASINAYINALNKIYYEEEA